MRSELAANEYLGIANAENAEYFLRDAKRSSALHPNAGEPRQRLRLTRSFDARPRHVFDAWLDPSVAARWLFATACRPLSHVDIDPRLGGAFCFVDGADGEAIEYSGEYADIVPNRRLVFTLAIPLTDRAITRVAVTISSLNRRSRLNLVHEDVPSAHARYLHNRWTGILYGLGVTLAMTP